MYLLKKNSFFKKGRKNTWEEVEIQMIGQIQTLGLDFTRWLKSKDLELKQKVLFLKYVNVACLIFPFAKIFVLQMSPYICQEF